MVAAKHKFWKGVKQGLSMRICRFVVKICRFHRFCNPSVTRFFAYGAVAWYTAAMQLFTYWMWTDANQSKLMHVNAVIVNNLECNVFKETNSFCDVTKKRSSLTFGPREILTFLSPVYKCPAYFSFYSLVDFSNKK